MSMGEARRGEARRPQVATGVGAAAIEPTGTRLRSPLPPSRSGPTPSCRLGCDQRLRTSISYHSSSTETRITRRKMMCRLTLASSCSSNSSWLISNPPSLAGLDVNFSVADLACLHTHQHRSTRDTIETYIQSWLYLRPPEEPG